jgi:hypothetical protein
MFSILAAALLTQQVLTQTPCYAALLGLCSEPPKHSKAVIPAPMVDGWMPIQSRSPPMLPTLAFVLITGFTANNGAMATIVVPGLADENACHALALKIGAAKHGCFEYKMATSHADVADAVQDELQDSGIIR